MDPLQLVLIGRIIERLLIVVAAIICLWIGGRLFTISTSPDHTAELTFKDFILKLQKVSPGIFFGFFGAAILVFSINKPLDIDGVQSSKEGTTQGSISYLQTGLDKVELERLIAATNSASNIAAFPPESDIVKLDRELLHQTSEALSDAKLFLLYQRFGKENFEAWKQWKHSAKYRFGKSPPSNQKILEQIEDISDKSFIEYVR